MNLICIGQKKKIHIKYKNAKKVLFNFQTDDSLTMKMIQSQQTNAYIFSKIEIGKDVIIENNCVLDSDIKIGDNTRIYYNVTIIKRARIGKIGYINMYIAHNYKISGDLALIVGTVIL